MNPMYPNSTSLSCNIQPSIPYQPQMSYLPPFTGDVMTSQNSCNNSITATVKGLSGYPFNDLFPLKTGVFPVFNDTKDKWEMKTIVELFAENPSLLPQISANTAGLQALSQKGIANGYASLDAFTKVPVNQLSIMISSSQLSPGVSGMVPTPLPNLLPGTRYLADDATWKTLANTQILTTKGDILTRDGSTTSDVRLPVGTLGQYLSVDSTVLTGLKWVDGSIIELASPSNLPAILLPKTLYLTVSNLGTYANIGGNTVQVNKLTGQSDFITDSATTASFVVPVTGNDYIKVAPISNYPQPRIVTFPTVGVTKGYKVTFATFRMTPANISLFGYVVGALDLDGATSTDLTSGTTFDFTYTGTQWERTN